MPSITTRQATLVDLDGIAPLFDAYRQFYAQPADLALARSYIRERMQRRESVIFVAQTPDGGLVGFTQLYPTFCSVRAAPTFVLYDLFSGVTIAPHQRGKLERLCRYVSRPPVASERLALTASGQVRYALKTPYRDGTTHLVLEPLDLMARLAALVPPPRRHLTRFHGVFAPHSQLRAAVTPAHRGLGAAPPPTDPVRPPTPRHVALSWARRLKRVFGIEIEGCVRCGGQLKIVVSIEEPEVIAKILAHLERTAPQQYPTALPLGARAPPLQSSLI